MKKLVLSALAAGMALSVTSAMAADLKPVYKAPALAAPASPWDIAFGGALMSDYNFRGISQSQKGSSATAYVETRYNVNPNLQLYAGSQYWAVDLPTQPSCECDFFAGIRPTVGPLAFDFGYIYYYYPKEVFAGTVGLSNTDYWEVYGKVGYEAIKDRLTVGATVFYSPSWLNTGGDGLYAAVNAKVNLPSFNLNVGLINEVTWYASGEYGHYWLGTADNTTFTAFDLPDYSTWNVGVAFGFAKVFTLDLRYYDTDLSKSDCFLLSGDVRGSNTETSRLCGSAFIATLKADLTYQANLK
jgi:uncharacterized protein (TIGR02001 family)